MTGQNIKNEKTETSKPVPISIILWNPIPDPKTNEL